MLNHLPTVLVLASGRGERYLASGGSTHKLQADLCGKTVLQRTLDAVVASGLNWHLEDAGHPGMGDSIASAVRATRNAPGWLILPADLPLIQAVTLQLISNAALPCDVLVPTHAGHRGHPVRFSPACGDALAALAGSKGAASVVKCYRSAELEVNDVGCVMDIDTVSDLERARLLFLTHYLANDFSASLIPSLTPTSAGSALSASAASLSL
jgi:molybdenum cofactor cytidylyltransferase